MLYHAQGPRLPAKIRDVAFVSDFCQVKVDGAGGFEPDQSADLPDGGRVTVVCDEVTDGSIDFGLAVSHKNTSMGTYVLGGSIASGWLGVKEKCLIYKLRKFNNKSLYC